MIPHGLSREQTDDAAGRLPEERPAARPIRLRDETSA